MTINLKKVKEYFLVTGFVWLFYAITLPVYFISVFQWTFDDIVFWWITGTPIQFILSYPMAKLLVLYMPWVEKVCGTAKDNITVLINSIMNPKNREAVISMTQLIKMYDEKGFEVVGHESRNSEAKHVDKDIVFYLKEKKDAI